MQVQVGLNVQAQTWEYLTQGQEGVTGAGPGRSNYAGTDIGMPRTNTGESNWCRYKYKYTGIC
jgi:hypothetical protein